MEGNLLFIQNLVLTLLLGGLIGLERERNKAETDSHEFGGIRTMSLAAVFGYLVYSLFGADLVLFSVLSAGFLALVVASYVMSSYLNKNTGATTEVAAFFVYLIGILMARDELLYAAVMTMIVLLLLYFKEALHKFAHKVEKKELYGTLKFIAVIAIVLPLLPDQVYGPLDVFNPHTVWLMIVLVSGISFVSYVAIKLLGSRKGVGLSGFLGGLISSTAVSMSFSQLSRRNDKIVNPFVFGIMIASSAMFFRILLEAAVLNPELAIELYVSMLSMGIAGLLISLYYWFKKGQKKKVTDEQMDLKSPFQIWPALQFGLFFAALLFISKFASLNFGDEGLYLTALISGLADVDAITVSVANLTASGDITLFAGSTAITIAAMTNTLVKGFIVLFFGSRSLGIRTISAIFLVILLGILALILLTPELYGIASV